MEFEKFVDYADRISNESKNTIIREHISDLLSETEDKENTRIVARYIQGRKFPKIESRNLNFSTSLTLKAISEVTCVGEDVLSEKMVDVDNISGLFSHYSIKNNSGQQQLFKDENLTIKQVNDVFYTISNISGSGSQREKIDYVVSLLSRCSSQEAEYLTKLILGDMNIGVGESSVRDAISQSNNIDKEIVERAIMLSNDIGEVAYIADKEGKEGLENIGVKICESPISPMKAKASKITNVLEDIGTIYIYAEYKYDGFRIQAHKDGDDIQLYTRKLENVTESLPDVVEIVKEYVSEESVILDGEIVGYEPKNPKKPLPYHVTQKRIKRKHNIDEMVSKIPLKPRFFDILYSSSKGLVINNPFEKRRNLLQEVCDLSILSVCKSCQNLDDVEEIMAEAEEKNYEGLMAKNPLSDYKPNNRGKNWLKLKPDGETIDAVVIGGEYGKGRRSDYIASYELAVWDMDESELKKIGEVGTGFTDKEYEKFTNKFEDEVVYQSGSYVTFNPTTVFEVRLEEIQPSSKYDSGYSIRFPRFIDERHSKSVEDADTVERIKNIKEIL